MGPTETVAAYGAAWNEPDEAKRRELLARSWSVDGFFHDPQGRVEGRDALLAHIAGFQQALPGHRIDLTSAIHSYDRYVRFAWKIFDGSNGVVLEGVNFGEFDGDGKLKSIVGFWGPLPEAE